MRLPSDDTLRAALGFLQFSNRSGGSLRNVALGAQLGVRPWAARELARSERFSETVANSLVLKVGETARSNLVILNHLKQGIVNAYLP